MHQVAWLNPIAMKKISQILDRKGRSIVSIAPDAHVLDALKLMAEKNIGSVVVLDKGSYAGMITERDYARKVILKGKTSAETLVSDIMSTDFPRISPSDSVDHAMQLMGERNIRYLPVFEHQQLCGIISINDLVRETLLDQQETIDQLHSYIHS